MPYYSSRPKSVAIFLLLFLLPVQSVLADDIFRYSEEDPRLGEIIEEATGLPSAYHQNIVKNIVGNWYSVDNKSDAYTDFEFTKPRVVWKALNFYKDGIFDASYELQDKRGCEKSISGTYRFIKKGSLNKFPGRKPNIILKPDKGKGSGVAVLIRVGVGLDVRFPLDRVVLKFLDMEGNTHFLVSER